MQAHCFPAALYLVARPGIWDQGRALQDKPRPRPVPSWHPTGGDGRVSAPPLLAVLSCSILVRIPLK